MNPTLYSRFKEVAKAHASNPAIIDERNVVKYETLDRLTDTMLSRFPSYVPARVGIVMDHSAEMIAAILAVLKCGGAFVAVDPDFPRERMNRFLTECGIDFVVTQPEYASALYDFRQFIVGKNFSVDETLHEVPDRSRADRAAYILYTSTTSGYPLGVSVGNRQVLAMAEAFGKTFHITPDDVVMQFSSSVVNIFIQEVFGTLLNGATLAIPSAATRSDRDALVRFADDNYVSIISGFPYLMQELNTLPSLPLTLRTVISSGDQLAPSAVGHLMEQVTVYNTYGGPENTVFSTAYCCNDGVALPNGQYPLGKPVEGVEVMILDDNLRPVAPGKTGEICFAGEFVADGYIGDHRNEMNTLTTLEDGTRIYRTGDMGRVLADGSVAYLRRKDQEVNIFGKRVVTDEVERALKASDEVKDCFVMDYQDEKGSAYLVAYVVPESSSLRLSWVKNKLAQYLSAYMIPEFFVLLRQLPVNAAGKVNPLALPVVLKDAIAG